MEMHCNLARALYIGEHIEFDSIEGRFPTGIKINVFFTYTLCVAGYIKNILCKSKICPLE